MNLLGFVWDSWWHLLLNILVSINSVVHQPVVAIVVFTIFIKLFTVPLTVKSLRSTRNMQRVQPLIKEVQKKYGKDKAKQQEETMRIYQQYGINPAAGCFPMLITLPIFFGLYSALNNTIQHGADPNWLRPILFNASLVPFANFTQPFLWIGNLAKPDPLYIIPLLSGVFQFLQSRMAMPVRDPNSPLDPQTKMMNNVMQFMPLYIIFISLNFPAGTVIYWAVSNIFSAVQQYFITGWGSLPNVPGLGFLPKRLPTIPEPLPAPSLDSVPVKRGMFQRMMDAAVNAQEAQKAAQQEPVIEEKGAASDKSKSVSGASRRALATANGSNGIVTAGTAERVKKRGSDPQGPRPVSTSTVKYASDLRRREAIDTNGNGAYGEESGYSSEGLDGAEGANGENAAQLPRKRRNKR